VRQPEVARLTRLLLAVVLVLPVLRGAERLGVASAFLVEFSGAPWAPLSALTAPPQESPRGIPGVIADRYRPRQIATPTPLILVPGVTPAGKDDARARAAARLLARAGFDVTLPTIPGLTTGRLRSDDVAPVIAVLAAAERPSVLIAVSIGSGPALIAAAAPQVRDRVALIVSLGGYGSAPELVRFYLSGHYDYANERGHRRHDPELVRAFVEANADLLEDPALLRDTLEALSPTRVVSDITAPLVLIHGRDDPVVPFTESLRLADARRAGTSLVLVDVLGHIGAAADGGFDWRAVTRLWQVSYRLVRAAG
jgi:pimeloyl-ACP methyl ester carboxylesterase